MEQTEIVKTSKGFLDVQIKQEPTFELSIQSFHSPVIKTENDCKSNLLNKHHTSELNQIEGKTNTVEFLQSSLPSYLSVNSSCKKEIQTAWDTERDIGSSSYNEMQKVFDRYTFKSEITFQPNCHGDILQGHMTNCTHPDSVVKEVVKTADDATLLEQQNPIVFPVALEKVSVTSEEVEERVKFEVDETVEQQKAVVFPVALGKVSVTSEEEEERVKFEVDEITVQQKAMVFPVALEKVSVTSEEVEERVKFEVDEITVQQKAMIFPVALEKVPDMSASSDEIFTISIEKISNKQFTCDHCGAVFDQLKDLSLHLKIHPINSLNLSICEKCNSLFITKYHLDDHKCGTDSEFNKHQYTSNLSKAISDKKSQKQQNHQANSSKQSTFILPNNKSVIPNIPVLPQPLATVTKDNRVVPMVMMGVIVAKQPQALLYNCMHCTQAFATMKELDIHLESHPRYRPYKCKYCVSSFLYKNQYKSHLRRHLGIRPFPCEECGSSFYTKTELVSHLKCHLPKEKSCLLAKYLCDQCGKKCKSKKCLDDHMTTHTKMRNYKCPICGAAFAQKSTMKSHMRVHRKEKSFTCTSCGFSTKWKNALEKHEELHQKGKQTYKCRDCYAEFLYKVQLTKHMQSHKVFASSNTHG